MDRRDFQSLARARAREAGVLLASRQYSGAYYLSGYAVEFALKACIAKQTRASEFPPRPDEVRRIYSHNFDQLLLAAHLIEALTEATALDSHLNENWRRAKDWTEESRYEKWPRDESYRLYTAITEQRHGVLAWLTQYW